MLTEEARREKLKEEREEAGKVTGPDQEKKKTKKREKCIEHIGY